MKRGSVSTALKLLSYRCNDLQYSPWLIRAALSEQGGWLPHVNGRSTDTAMVKPFQKLVDSSKLWTTIKHVIYHVLTHDKDTKAGRLETDLRFSATVHHCPTQASDRRFLSTWWNTTAWGDKQASEWIKEGESVIYFVWDGLWLFAPMVDRVVYWVKLISNL